MIFRRSEGETRPIAEIALEELRALALVVRSQRLAVDEDPLVAMSRIAGLQRLRTSSRDRLETAMRLALTCTHSTAPTDSATTPATQE